MGPPLRSIFSLTLTVWGPPHVSFFAYYMGAPSDQFICLLCGGHFRSVSSHIIWGGGGGPQVSFFAYYIGGSPQINFFAYYRGPPRSVSLLLYGAPLGQFLRLLYGPPQVSFFAYYMGAPSD